MSESFAELFGKSTTSFKEGEVVKGTVLTVDNDRAVNALLSEVLVGVGLSCESACDGEQALARLRGGGVHGESGKQVECSEGLFALLMRFR